MVTFLLLDLPAYSTMYRDMCVIAFDEEINSL